MSQINPDKESAAPSNSYYCSKSAVIKREQRIAYLCLGCICIIWGTTFLVMRIGVRDFPPFLFAGIRQVIAGLLLTNYLLLIKKVSFPSWSNIIRQAFWGFFMITLGNGLITWAEVYVPSGVAAIICCLMPVWVIVINLTANRSEMPNATIILGVLTGLSGILLVFREHLGDFANRQYQLGIAFVFIASLTWAMGSVFLKKSKDNSNPFFNIGLQMVFAGLWCLVLSLLFDDLTDVRFTSQVIFSLTYLSVVGSAIAFVLYAYALTQLPVTIASLYSYINPIVAVFLGWLLLDEKMNFEVGIAIVVTIGGIYLVNRGYQAKTHEAAEPPPAES